MRFNWMAATLVMSSGLCLAQSEPPSLADIARKNQAERRQEKSRIVITDDNLLSRTPAAPLGTGAGKGSSAAGTERDSHGPDAAKPDAASVSDSGPQTEKKEVNGKSGTPPPSPQQEVERLKKELDSLKAQQEGWKSSAAKYEEKLAVETSEFRRSMYQDALDNNRQNVAFFQHKIGEAQSKLASAEEAAAASRTGALSLQTGADLSPPRAR